MKNSTTIKLVPQRIVSLVPSQTELVVDLGLQENLVGITKFCVHPSGLKKEKTRVGGTKKVNFSKIKALQPDIILCNKEENTLEMVLELQKIAPVHVSSVASIPEAYQLITEYGTLFRKETKAAQLIQEIQQNFAELQMIEKPKRPIRVAYFIWKNPWMVAGNGTFINAMLEELGFMNAFGKLSRYPVVDVQALPEMDWVFLSSEPYPFKETDYSDFTNLHHKILLVDGESFSWYGSRMLKNKDYFTNLLHYIYTKTSLS